MRISDGSSDVCSSDLAQLGDLRGAFAFVLRARAILVGARQHQLAAAFDDHAAAEQTPERSVHRGLTAARQLLEQPLARQARGKIGRETWRERVCSSV